jgi:hypothetical protein
MKTAVLPSVGRARRAKNCKSWFSNNRFSNRVNYIIGILKFLAACCTCRFLRHFVPQKPRYMGSLRSLQGKKSPDRRFFGDLSAKRDKLLDVNRMRKTPVYRSTGAPDPARAACCCVQVARRAPEPGLAKFQANGGARSGTRSVLFVPQAARRAPEPGFTKIQLNGGAEPRRSFRRKPPPVRAQGIGGVRSSHGVEGRVPERRGRSARARSPAKPGRRSRMRPNYSLEKSSRCCNFAQNRSCLVFFSEKRYFFQ